MSDVIVVTWSSDHLELRQVASTGTWQPHTPPIRTYELNRPTRPMRLFDADSGGSLHLALTDLFSDLEINQPVWLLLPHNWMQTFKIQTPKLSSPEMQRAHILWEAQQRLAGEIINYRVSFVDDLSKPKSTIHIVRGDVIETFEKAAVNADIEIAGIGYEPEWGMEYDFEIPSDLRENVSADILYTEGVVIKETVPPGLSIGIGVVILAMAFLFFAVLPTGFDTEYPLPVTTASLALDSTGAVVLDSTGVVVEEKTGEIETAEAVEKTVAEVKKPGWWKSLFKSKEKPGELEVPAVATQERDSVIAAAESSSPINRIVRFIPSGASVQLAVLSQVDCKLEISGLANPNAWLKDISKSPTLELVSLADSYECRGKNISVVRLLKVGWRSDTKARNLDKWTNIVSTSGMTPNGRSARGDMASALKLLDAVWAESCGFEKVYLAPENGQWLVTVQ